MRWSGPARRLCDLIAFHQSALHLLVRVCVAEAESMATDLSRSPLYVRGGHLHALEKLFVAHSIHRQEDMAWALFFGTALGRFKGQGCWQGWWYRNCLGSKAGCGLGMGR